MVVLSLRPTADYTHQFPGPDSSDTPWHGGPTYLLIVNGICVLRTLLVNAFGERIKILRKLFMVVFIRFRVLAR